MVTRLDFDSALVFLDAKDGSLEDYMKAIAVVVAYADQRDKQIGHMIMAISNMTCAYCSHYVNFECIHDNGDEACTDGINTYFADDNNFKEGTDDKR